MTKRYKSLEIKNTAQDARERRERVVKKIATLGQLSDGIQHSPAAVKLSNPAFNDELPFPYVGKILPQRFHANDQCNWFYTGREKFMELLDMVKNVQQDRRYRTLWLYGSRGYGKSHLLAALVCYLAATENERVVYLPDCRECLSCPVSYIRTAMLFAWANDDDKQLEIMGINTTEMIADFFEANEKVIFVIDQYDAFDLSDTGQSRLLDKKKEDLLNFLDGIRASGNAVISSSANYRHYLETKHQQASQKTLCVYGGLTEVSLSKDDWCIEDNLTIILEEMKEWWKRIKADLGKYTKDEIEDLTGCIPLLLESCIVDGKFNLEVGDMKQVWDDAAKFVMKIKKGNNLEWDQYMHLPWTATNFYSYCDYVDACIRRRTVPAGTSASLIDHRYFYSEESEGNYTCGIAREAVARQLWKYGRNRFGVTKRLQSLEEYVGNQSVTGFFIEHAVLQTISTHGPKEIGIVNSPPPIIIFEGFPDFKDTEDPILYVPSSYFYPAIDGVILQLDHSKREAYMFPI